MSAQKAMNMHKKVRALQGKLSCAAKQSLDRRFGALYDKLYREETLNRFVYDRLRIFLKRKYNDQSRGKWRLVGKAPEKLGLAQFG
jgi:hypothetical protein